MAFFKFRKGESDAARPAPVPPESVEVLRRRARQRLVGAAVLVLLGVVGFPILFDTQPRPVAVDIPIDIPDRAKARPLAPAPAPEPIAEPAPAAVAAAPSPVSAPVPAAVPVASTAVVSPAAEGNVAATVAPAAAPAPAPVSRPEPVARATNDNGTRALALLEGQDRQADPDPADGRIVVQVGAFADPAKAREVRLKLERAGLKTYTHVADTKDGKRTRVRVGPFATRAEADKAAQKIKGLDLPAAILTL